VRYVFNFDHRRAERSLALCLPADRLTRFMTVDGQPPGCLVMNISSDKSQHEFSHQASASQRLNSCPWNTLTPQMLSNRLAQPLVHKSSSLARLFPLHVCYAPCQIPALYTENTLPSLRILLRLSPHSHSSSSLPPLSAMIQLHR
jgi:hypothetical protein